MNEFRAPSSAPPPRPMVVDGANHDAILANSRFLSREELLRRRLRRVRQLSRCYRAYYWALMDELKSKYKHYCWTYGLNPFKDDRNNNNNNEHNSNGVVSGVGGDDIVRCRFGGCKSKAMALTKFCHAHILSDSNQVLYRGCRAVVKNLSTGPSFCNKPVLRSMVPPACPTHYALSERCLVRAIRKARVGNSIPINRLPCPKLHVIASEFVHQIQSKRKVALKKTVPKANAE